MGLKLISKEHRVDTIFFYQGFLSRTFTIYKTALPLLPVSQTLRHQLGDYWREITFAQSQNPNPLREPLLFEPQITYDQFYTTDGDCYFEFSQKSKYSHPLLKILCWKREKLKSTILLNLIKNQRGKYLVSKVIKFYICLQHTFWETKVLSHSSGEKAMSCGTYMQMKIYQRKQYRSC